MRVRLLVLCGLCLVSIGLAPAEPVGAARSGLASADLQAGPGHRTARQDEHAIRLAATVGSGLVRNVVTTGSALVVGVYSDLQVFESDEDGFVQHATTLRLGGVIRSLKAAPDMVTVTDASGALSLVDVSAPRSARIVATIDPAIDGALIHLGLLDGDRVYALDVDVLRVFDASSLDGIAPLAALPLPIRSAYDIDVLGGHLYLTTADEIVVIDVEDALAPGVVATITRERGPWSGIATRGHLLYATAQSPGVYVFDVSDPSAPKEVSSLDLDGISYEPYLFGDHLLVPRSSSGGLHIVDVHDPRSPTLVSTMLGVGTWSQAVQMGSQGYVAVSGIGLLQVDLSDPADPRPVEFILDGPGTTISVDVHKSVAYAMTFYGELFAYSLAAPASPAFLSRVDLEQKKSHDMARVGKRLFVIGVASAGSLIEVDTTDPADPTVSGAGSVPFIPSIIAACGDRLLVGGTHGLASYDAAGNGRPSMIKSHLQQGLSIRAVTCSGGQAFAIGIVENGVEILELDPWDDSTAFIVSTWTHDSWSRPSHLALTENSLIVGSESNVLFIDTSRDELTVRNVAPELAELKRFFAMGSEGDRVVANVRSQRIVSVDVSVPDTPRLAAVSDERLLMGADLAVEGPLIVAALGQPGFQVYVDSSITPPAATATPTTSSGTPTSPPTTTPSPPTRPGQVYLPLCLTWR